MNTQRLFWFSDNRSGGGARLGQHPNIQAGQDRASRVLGFFSIPKNKPAHEVFQIQRRLRVPDRTTGF